MPAFFLPYEYILFSLIPPRNTYSKRAKLKGNYGKYTTNDA